MNPENGDGNNAESTGDGTVPFNPETNQPDPHAGDLEYRKRLQRLRDIATQMFFVQNEHYPWLQQTPDKWILGIMEELRPAANNIFDFDKFRASLLKAGAAIFVSILEGDDLFRANQGPVSLDHDSRF